MGYCRSVRCADDARLPFCLATTIEFSGLGLFSGANDQMSPRETVLAFVDAINAHDVARLGESMSDDHTFVDPYGSGVVGREAMLAGWRGYFEWFPDYQIEVNDIFERENEFAMFGFAGGSFKGATDRKWRLPAAWKAVVHDGRITLWQVVADTKLPLESMSGS
jgi:hypothetical protein